jgi:hypothetical protein
MNLLRLFILIFAVPAALLAGAVVSIAQSPHVPPPAATGCDGALPSGAPATTVKFDGIAGDHAVEHFRITPGGSRPLLLGKAIDKASPQLVARLVSGAHIPKLTLAQAKVKYTLTDITVLEVEHSGRGDRVCLGYAQGELEYVPDNPNGSPGAPVKAQF